MKSRPIINKIGCPVMRGGLIIFTLVLSLSPVRVLAAAPTAPSLLTAQQDVNADGYPFVTLNWHDNSNNETGFIIESTVGTIPADWEELDLVGPNIKTYVDESVFPGETFWYRVYAFNGAENSSPSNQVSITVTEPGAPAAPSQLQGIAVNSYTVNLTWKDNATDETGFEVDRDTSSGFDPYDDDFTSFDVPRANATQFVDTSVEAGLTYFYRVMAYNDIDLSPASNIFMVVVPANPGAPAAPGQLAASVSAGADGPVVHLSWRDNSSDELDFVIEFTDDPSYGWGEIDLVGPNTTTYTDTGIWPDDTFYYRIFAENTNGRSVYSNIASVVVPPAGTPLKPNAPGNLTASLNGLQIVLTWVDTATNGTGFRVERATEAAFSHVQAFTVNYAVSSYTDTSVIAGTTYYYRVKAVNAAGESQPSNVVIIAVPKPLPAAPSGLTAMSSGGNQVTLTWIDNSSEETGFLIERSVSPNFDQALRTVQVGANIVTYNVVTYVDTPVTAGAIYYYRVKAVSSAGNSVASVVASVAVPLSDTTSTTTTAIPATTPTTTTSTAPVSSSLRPAPTPPISTLPLPPGLTMTVILPTTALPGHTVTIQPATTSPGITTTQPPGTDISNDDAPVGFSLNAGQRHILLTWYDNSDQESGYYIERSTGDSNWMRIGTAPINAGSFNDRGTYGKTGFWSKLLAFLFGGLERHTKYYYRVLAFNQTGIFGTSQVTAASTG